MIVFAAGFALGTMRILFITPAFGAVPAVTLEMPLILAVAWLTARAIISRLAIPQAAMPRLIMGGSAFALLMTTEFALSASLFGGGGQYLANLTTGAGLIGLAGQIVFALVPLAQIWLCDR
ncbi:hypothetical protein [Bosea sp. 685]|uniref:hypothetical protein n=1 Tax=Bosea sp. 685 TaxID=3080057 RepID=UPI0028930EA2|nr:hypothetical protein [Bosea sp. 685]WNJ93533.1 hypothetical protein RMR04_15110 [Bosea sp. 685]